MSIASNSLLEQRGHSQTQWSEWRWQQRNAIRTTAQLRDAFPGLGSSELDTIDAAVQTVRMQLTPYVIGLIECDEQGRSPLRDDPIWRQLVPHTSVYGQGHYDYDGKTENWEMPEEMVTPIAQHKYPNRIIVRAANVCLSYCQFCYEALRTLERKSEKGTFQQELWQKTLEYVQEHEEIEEIILSGGEPLMLSNSRLDKILEQIRALDRDLLIRIHTRVLTFNPFRVTEALCDILKRHRIAAFGLHVCHPNELTAEFEQGAARLQSVCPILFANIPLLRGVNDDIELMHRLCMGLYKVGVIPHYLYHFMPHSPASDEFRTPVRTGVEIARALKRNISNVAVPEFVLPHYSGKHTMPLLAEREEPPYFYNDPDGRNYVRYSNWKGQQVEYFDGVDRE